MTEEDSRKKNASPGARNWTQTLPLVLGRSITKLWETRNKTANLT